MKATKPTLTQRLREFDAEPYDAELAATATEAAERIEILEAALRQVVESFDRSNSEAGRAGIPRSHEPVYVQVARSTLENR